jgi:hypothetical protein
MMSVWGEGHIIVYLSNAGILHDIPFCPEGRLNKKIQQDQDFKIFLPECSHFNGIWVRIRRVYPDESVF